MWRFLAARALQSLLVIALVVSATFFLVRLAPGDPFAYEDARMPESARQHWRHEFGYDQPIATQYVRFVAAAARGQFGWSHSYRRPVAAVLADAVPRTLLLTGVALVLAFAIGIAAGVIEAVRAGSPGARALHVVLVTLYSMPDFWAALLLLVAFAYWIPVFPAGGVVDVVMYDHLGTWGQLVDRLRHLVLPATTLALLTAAAIARYQRAATLEVLPADFVRTARAKGVPERVVVRRHVLRNALLPVITLAGLLLPALVSGAVFVEKVFSWPGMGLAAVNAVGARDYDLITASVIVGAVLVATGSLLADVLYAAVDPRLRVR